MNPTLMNVIAGVVASVLRQHADSTAPGTVPSPNAVASDVTEILATDPVVRNATNSEAPIKSRVVVGSSAAIIAALVTILSQFGVCTTNPVCWVTNWGVVYPAVAVILGAAYALYGRLKSGLKPLGG